jgi:hypothetical protein
MMCNSSTALLGFLAVLTIASGTQFRENPMRKIITMLQDMSSELEREGEMEKELFDKAMCACETSAKESATEIADLSSQTADVEAKIGQGKAEKSQLTQEIEDHKVSLETATADLDSATSIRAKEQKENAIFIKKDKMSIHQLSKAIPALEQGLSSAAFLQTLSPKAATRLHRMVEVTRYLQSEERVGFLAFLDQGMGDDMADAEQAPSSAQVVGMMKSMKEEMEKDLEEIEEKEKMAAATFAEMANSKNKEISVAKDSIISKEKRLGALALELSENSHTYEDAQESLASAQKLSATLAADCAEKTKDRNARLKARNEEMVAISDAVKILNDDDALEIFSKAKGASLLERNTPTLRVTYDAFVQISSHLKHKHTHKHRASLQTRATQPDEGGNSEAKKLVSGLIDGMVSVLHDEDVNDEVKKSYCNNETEVNDALFASKKAELSQISSKYDEMIDSQATLVEEMKALEQTIAEIDKEVHEATVQRKKEHQEFVDEFATSGTAIRLVTKAINRLQKFYSPKAYKAKTDAVKNAALQSAGLALLSKSASNRPKLSLGVQRAEALLGGADFDAFVQVRMSARGRVMLPDTPSGFVQKQESGGVIGLMEEFKSDIKIDMVESETDEKHAAQDYTSIMAEYVDSRKGSVKSLNQKTKEKAALDVKIVSDKEAIDTLEKEINNLELFLVRLHAECDFIMRNFEERHDGRVDEEMGLESAKSIVTKETPPSYGEVEERYEEEDSSADVDENFPGAPR